jgi:phage baseplate assembly protein W
MSTYTGFSTTGSEFASTTLTDYQLVKQDLINHFNVRRGERVMRPDFGCVIWDMLFDPFTDEAHSLIIENIENIVNFDPRLEVLEVVPTSYEHGIQIIITLKYIPTNQVEDMLYTFNQEASQVTSSVVLDNNNSGSETTGASGSGY